MLNMYLFATVVVHAYYLQNTAYHHLFLAAAVLSMHPNLLFVRKLAVKFAFLHATTETRLAIEKGKLWIVAFPVWVFLFWLLSLLPPAREHRVWMHKLLLCTAVLGVHAYLRQLHSLKKIK